MQDNIVLEPVREVLAKGKEPTRDDYLDAYLPPETRPVRDVREKLATTQKLRAAR